MPRLCLSACLVITCAHAAAAAETRWYDRFTLSGYVDVYFAYNTNRPNSDDNFLPGAGTTAKKHNQLSLNLATIELAAVEPFIVHLALNVGGGTEVLHAAEPTGSAIGPDVWKLLQQAYLGYRLPIGRGLIVEGGLFPSHVGFEVLPSKDNWNYTRSWMAENSPYYQAGVRVTYGFTDRLSAQLLYLNGWQIIGEDNGWKTLGTQLVYSGPRITASLNTIIGPEQPHSHSTWRFFFDGIVQINATDRLQMAATADYGFEQLPDGGLGHWYAGAVYLRSMPRGWLALTGRLEAYHDGLGTPPGMTRVLTGQLQTLIEATFTVEVRALERVIVKLEGRYDHSDQPVFETREQDALTRTPLTVGSQGLVVLGAVATF